MKKIFALNLLLMSAVAHAQELPYFAINNPDNNGTGNSAGLFSLNSPALFPVPLLSGLLMAK